MTRPELIRELNNFQNNHMDLNHLSQIVHAANAKWWQDIDTGSPDSATPIPVRPATDRMVMQVRSITSHPLEVRRLRTFKSFQG